MRPLSRHLGYSRGPRVRGAGRLEEREPQSWPPGSYHFELLSHWAPGDSSTLKFHPVVAGTSVTRHVVSASRRRSAAGAGIHTTERPKGHPGPARRAPTGDSGFGSLGEAQALRTAVGWPCPRPILRLNDALIVIPAGTQHPDAVAHPQWQRDRRTPGSKQRTDRRCRLSVAEDGDTMVDGPVLNPARA